MKEETYITMDYHELEDLIEKTFGHPYEVVAEEEWHNDSSHAWSFKVESLNEWDQKVVDDFIATGKTPNYRTPAFMQHMVNTGVLKPGNYLIEVCW